MRRVLLFVLSVLMLASLSVGAVFAATGSEYDENGWFQNANMTQLKTNAEGASEFTFTAGGVTTYNSTAMDLTKPHTVYIASTAGNWTGVYLVDDYSKVSAGGGIYDPATPGMDFAKVTMLVQSGGMQCGRGYSTTGGMVGADQGAPTDITVYNKFEFFIGTGGESKSYVKINDVEVIGEAKNNSEELTVTREDFAEGKCYLVLQTLGADMTIKATGIDKAPQGVKPPLQKGDFDENGWYQNANMDPITINDEGASVLNFTSGSIVTYNKTELDLTKVNYFYVKITSGKSDDWSFFHLFDDVSNIPETSIGGLFLAGSAPAYVKVSMNIGSAGMQLGNGYAPSAVIGTKQGTPSDLSKYFKVEIYIGAGGEADKSYIKIDSMEVLGQNGETLNVTRSDFTNGKCYVAWQTANFNLPLAVTGINKELVGLPAAEILPLGTGTAKNAGFMLDQQIDMTGATEIPEVGKVLIYSQEAAVGNVTINGAAISEFGAQLAVVENNGIQALGFLPADGKTFAWAVGDTVLFKEGFTVYNADGRGAYKTTKDFEFRVASVADGNVIFAVPIGLTNVGANGNYVNLDLSANVAFDDVVTNATPAGITFNDDDYAKVGHFNLATENIIQLLKNDGEWTWQEGDTIVLPKNYVFYAKEYVEGYSATYCLDEEYQLVYTNGAFTLTKVYSDYREVVVSSMALGHYDAAGNVYGMQIHFSENVFEGHAASDDIAGEAWFNEYIKVNGTTLADIMNENVGTEEAPVKATVRANTEKINVVTLWIDTRSQSIFRGDNKLGNDNVVTIMQGLKFADTGYEVKEEQSFKYTDPNWNEIVVLAPIEMSVQKGDKLDAGVNKDGTVFLNIPINLSSLTSIAAFPTEASMDVTDLVMFNGSYFSQMQGVKVFQYNSANTLQLVVSQTAWNDGDVFILFKGLPFYTDIPSSPNAQKAAELARYYIFTYSAEESKFIVDITDSYDADEDIELKYTGVTGFRYDSVADAYVFELHFSKNVRGDVYENLEDITNEAWVKDYLLINGKTITELLAAKDASGADIANAVKIMFTDKDVLSISVSAKIPQSAGGVVDADGNVISKVTFSVLDGFTVPRGGAIAVGVNYKYEFGGWGKDIDLSEVEYHEIKVTSVSNPVSVDTDGNIAFKVYFDQPITDVQYRHINATVAWLSTSENLGYNTSTIEYLLSYGFLQDCQTKILFNGETIQQWMNKEKDEEYRSMNVVMVHYDKNELQIVFRTNSINKNDGTEGQRTPYAIDLSATDPDWSITFLAGFTVPSFGKVEKTVTYKYDKDVQGFVEVEQQEVISSVEFDEVYYDGVKIEQGGTLTLKGVTALDKNLFTVYFKDGVNAPWSIEGGELKVGDNAVKLVATTTDGSGKTVEFSFTVKVEKEETASGGCNSSAAFAFGAMAACALAAGAVLTIKKGKKA